MEYLILAALWVMWCAMHSGLISLSLTEKVNKLIGPKYKFYRLFYNFLSLLTLILLIIYSNKIKNHIIFIWEGEIVLLQIALIVLAVLLFLSGFRHYDFLQFLGIRQILTGSSYGSLSDTNEIDTSGILGITRHPWYLATIILVWVYFKTMFLSTCIVSIILSVYLIIGTILEERKLIKEYGNVYRNYQKEVSMIFPFKWFWSLIMKKEKNG